MLQLFVQNAISGHQFVKHQDTDHHVDLSVRGKQEHLSYCAKINSKSLFQNIELHIVHT